MHVVAEMVRNRHEVQQRGIPSRRQKIHGAQPPDLSRHHGTTKTRTTRHSVVMDPDCQANSGANKAQDTARVTTEADTQDEDADGDSQGVPTSEMISSGRTAVAATQIKGDGSESL